MQLSGVHGVGAGDIRNVSVRGCRVSGLGVNGDEQQFLDEHGCSNCGDIA